MVFAGVRSDKTKAIAAACEYADAYKVKYKPVIFDVTDTNSVTAAVEQVVQEGKCIDVVVHNAGHDTIDPAEPFTPEQLMYFFDISALATQRLNHVVLLHMRKAGDSLLVWTLSSTRCGRTPLLAPYFAAKEAMDSMAVSYSGGLARWGTETSIIVPGPFAEGSNFFPDMGRPAD